jgi:hypothetical protein
LRSHNDRSAVVQSIAAGGESAVYNLRVEENGAYFVGERDWGFSVWVYGACQQTGSPLKSVSLSQPRDAGLQNGISLLETVALSGSDNGRLGMDWRLLFGRTSSISKVRAASVVSKPQQRTPQSLREDRTDAILVRAQSR